MKRAHYLPQLPSVVFLQIPLKHQVLVPGGRHDTVLDRFCVYFMYLDEL